MKLKLLPVLSIILLASCNWVNETPTIKSIDKELDSLVKLRDSLVVLEKKEDSGSKYVYYYRSLSDNKQGVFTTTRILHSRDIIERRLNPLDTINQPEVIEILSESKKIKIFCK